MALRNKIAILAGVWFFLALNVFGDALFPGPIMRPLGAGQAPSGEPFQGLVSTNNLVSWWRFDESSAGSVAVTRVDSFGANNWTDITAFSASSAGKIGLSVDIESSASEYMMIGDNPSVSMPPGTSFTLTCWVVFESVSAARPIITKGTNSTSAIEYAILGNSSINFQGKIGDGTTVTTITNTTAPAISTWYFMAFRYDSTNQVIRLRINASLGPTISYTAGTYDGTSEVNLGRAAYATSQRLDGRVDLGGLWKRYLTDAELDALYGGGNGLDY